MKSGKDGDGVVREKASDRLKRLMQQNNEKIQQAQAMRLQHSENMPDSSALSSTMRQNKTAPCDTSRVFDLSSVNEQLPRDARQVSMDQGKENRPSCLPQDSFVLPHPPSSRPRLPATMKKNQHCSGSAEKGLISPISTPVVEHKELPSISPIPTERKPMSTARIDAQTPLKRDLHPYAVPRPVVKPDLPTPPPTIQSDVRSRSSSVDQKKESGGANPKQMQTPRMKPASSTGNLVPGMVTPRDRHLQNSFSTPSLHPQQFFVNDRCYQFLSVIGKGGSCKVYEVYDSTAREVRALKCVELSVDAEVREAYLNEIELLSSLQQCPYVIKMHDYEIREDENTMFVVLEKGELDLETMLRTQKERIDAKFINYHWRELLRCVKVIHDRKIVHSDLKPANFLMVKGAFKLIDFGIASSIDKNMTSAAKDLLMGTPSYMPPEMVQQDEGINKYKISLKADIWMLGCILYTMVYGAGPFARFRTYLQKVQAITNPDYHIEYRGDTDPLLVDTMKLCLERSAAKRATIDELLAHPYLTESQHARSPSRSDVQPTPDPTDFLALAKELQNNTPNTIAKKLANISRQAQQGHQRQASGDTARKVLSFD